MFGRCGVIDPLLRQPKNPGLDFPGRYENRKPRVGTTVVSPIVKLFYSSFDAPIVPVNDHKKTQLRLVLARLDLRADIRVLRDHPSRCRAFTSWCDEEVDLTPIYSVPY
jgi:hypothetical protein